MSLRPGFSNFATAYCPPPTSHLLGRSALRQEQLKQLEEKASNAQITAAESRQRDAAVASHAAEQSRLDAARYSARRTLLMQASQENLEMMRQRREAAQQARQRQIAEERAMLSANGVFGFEHRWGASDR